MNNISEQKIIESLENSAEIIHALQNIIERHTQSKAQLLELDYNYAKREIILAVAGKEAIVGISIDEVIAELKHE